MIAVFADTHGTDDLQLAGRAANALADAERVLHAGDFTTAAVYEAFEARTSELIAVHGNSDAAPLRDRLPAVETIEWNDRELLLIHGHEHTPTSLPLLARERGADLVITGHTHRPAIERLGDLHVLNPGSHTDPRASAPSYAELRQETGDVVIELREPTGKIIERRRVAGE